MGAKRNDCLRVLEMQDVRGTIREWLHFNDPVFQRDAVAWVLAVDRHSNPISNGGVSFPVSSLSRGDAGRGDFGPGHGFHAALGTSIGFPKSDHQNLRY